MNDLAAIGLERLRDRVTDLQKDVLDHAWREYTNSSGNRWPLVREIAIVHGPAQVSAAIEALPHGAAFVEQDHLQLSLLGALLTTGGTALEERLVDFLSWLQRCAHIDPKISLVKSDDMPNVSAMPTDEYRDLAWAIRLMEIHEGPYAPGGGRWHLRVSEEIASITHAADVRGYLHGRVFAVANRIGHERGLVPAAEVDHENREASEGPTDTLLEERMASILLEPEQIGALDLLVEASRSQPREQRQPFRAMPDTSSHQERLLLPTYPGLSKDVHFYPGDVRTLAREGLLHLEFSSKDNWVFEVTPLGYRHYEWRKRRQGTGPERIEQIVKSYIQTSGFAKRHPAALAKWSEAETQLWSAESLKALSTIGHLCREAHLEFASSLAALHPSAGASTHPSKVKVRVGAVLASWITSDSTRAYAEALGNYWETVVDLALRQDHASLKEGEPLRWEDARRLVFATIFAMTELDRLG